ncbi:hypothetical protein RRG08_002748 [Elysia crispata]|uniref:Uncharacterized protein n=1 Tax=Elysia crispata TaxID=231223 RepID=A0AAE1CMN8_9GAST|nr:hypothetical protein RRG08_002748 [Elysia crispata]
MSSKTKSDETVTSSSGERADATREEESTLDDSSYFRQKIQEAAVTNLRPARQTPVLSLRKRVFRRLGLS